MKYEARWSEMMNNQIMHTLFFTTALLSYVFSHVWFATPQEIVASTLPEMQNFLQCVRWTVRWTSDILMPWRDIRRGPYRNTSMWLRSVVRHSRNLNWAFLRHEFSKQGLGLKFLNSKKCRARLVLNYVHCFENCFRKCLCPLATMMPFGAKQHHGKMNKSLNCFQNRWLK